MFDKALLEDFLENPDDDAVRQQALKLIQLFRASRFYEQVHSDIVHAAKMSRKTNPPQISEIAFLMGLQFGFGLGLNHPPGKG
jgi:hypothetical protein